MSESLHIIGEGGAYSTLVYLIKQGIRPQNYIEHPDSLEDLIPYLGKEDTVMLLVRGLTDYTMQEVYSIISKLEEYKEKLKDTVVMTNIPLGDVKTPYYLYTGDIIYGTVVYIDEKGIEYKLNKDGKPIVEETTGFLWRRRVSEVEEAEKGNVIMKQMIDKERDHKPMVHQRKQREKETPKSEEEYVKHIRYIDLYNKENNT